MTSEEKLASVEAQIELCARGDSKQIICPYCDEVNEESRTAVCCDLFAKATTAVLQRWRAAETLHELEEIHYRAQQN